MKRLLGVSIALAILAGAKFVYISAVQAQMFEPIVGAGNGIPPAGRWFLCGDTSYTSGCVPSSSTTAYDSSTSGGNSATWKGTAHGSNNWYDTASGILPYQGHFDGSGNYLTITKNNFCTTACTESAWVTLTHNPPDSSNLAYILTISDDDGVHNNMMVRDSFASPNNTIQTYIYHSGYCGAVNSAVLSLNTRYYIAATWTGSTLTAYVNAVAGTGVACSGPLASFNGTTTIGARSSTGTRLWEGDIADARIYTTALTAAQVTACYNAGPGGIC